MKKRIAIVYNTSWYIYNFRRNLMLRLKKEGYEVFAIAPPDDYTEKLKKDFHFIPLTKLERKGMNPLKDILFLIELIRIYRKYKLDLLINFTIKLNIFSALACGLLRIKSIGTIAGLGYAFGEKGLLNTIVAFLYKISLKNNHIVFFQNGDDRKYMLSRKIVRKKATKMVPGSGVDINYYNPAYNGRKIQKNKKYSFILIARMIWEKGIMEYVKAAHIIKEKGYDAEFLLLGPVDSDAGPNAIPEKIIRKWEDEGIIRYFSFSFDVREQISICDAMVLPSYYMEGCPRTLLEAMALGKPIITTNSVGCKELIEHRKNGFMVPVKDHNALVEALENFINLPVTEREQMGQYSRNKIEKEYDDKIVINLYLNEIKKALNNKEDMC